MTEMYLNCLNGCWPQNFTAWAGVHVNMGGRQTHALGQGILWRVLVVQGEKRYTNVNVQEQQSRPL